MKLILLPGYDLLILVPFRSLKKAGEAVSTIFKAGLVPSGLELVEVKALQIISDYVKNTTIPIRDDIAAHLIIEVDGNNMDVLMKEMEDIVELMMPYEAEDVLFADDAQQKAELWKMRSIAAEAVKFAGW